MAEYTDGAWTSKDGLELHYRDYAGRGRSSAGAVPARLTRNARDFAGSGRPAGRRMARDRARRCAAGATANMPRTPPTIRSSMSATSTCCWQSWAFPAFSIGTSLGGLMTMLMAMNAPERLAGAVLNDIGTGLERAGLDRIAAMPGRAHFPDLDARRPRAGGNAGVAHPDFDLADWLAMAKRTMTLTSNGRIVFDYDMKIAEPSRRSISTTSRICGRPWTPGRQAVLILRGAAVGFVFGRNAARRCWRGCPAPKRSRCPASATRRC
jgi:pimeloyl-ACP methyl ester carboxylesterase